MHRIATLLILPLLAVGCADMGPLYITTDSASASASADCGDASSSTDGSSSADASSSTGAEGTGAGDASTGGASTGEARICTGIAEAPECSASGDFCADMNAMCLELGLDLSDTDPPGTDYCAIYAENCATADPCTRCWEIENLCWQLAPSGVAADCAGAAGVCLCILNADQ